MARILITWELGGGSGHVVPLKPIIEGLAHRGHSVVAAMRDLGRAATALPDCPLELLQAPFRLGGARNPIRPCLTFAHVLHDVGFADGPELQTLARAWRTLVQYVKPDLIICDHSPTALLAARGLPVLRAVLGFGFICPPDQSPLPNLRFWTTPDSEKLARDEANVLANMNFVLESLGQPPIACVDTPDAKLLAQVKGPAIRVERERLDMSAVARECDLAVCHAPHGTTAAMLLAGKPLMLLPIVLEQGLMAHAVCRMGAGVQAPAVEATAGVGALEEFVAGVESYAPAAQGFAAKYAGYDPIQANDRVIDAVDGLFHKRLWVEDIASDPTKVGKLRTLSKKTG